MTKDPGLGTALKAVASAERHRQNLKSANEKLAALVASLHDQKQRLEVFSRSGESPAAGGNGEAHMVSHLAERSMSGELVLARETLERRRVEQDRLQDRLVEIEGEHRRLGDEFAAVQEQNSDLVSFYAVIERLHGAHDRSEVLTAIQEIVINVVGSEQLALFEVTPDGTRLAPALAFGFDADGLKEIAVGSGPIGRSAAEGRSYFAGEEGAEAAPQDPHLTACIPLKLRDRVTGALAIYKLLGHKPALTDFDRELFALLARHAALALHLRAAVHGTGQR